MSKEIERAIKFFESDIRLCGKPTCCTCKHTKTALAALRTMKWMEDNVLNVIHPRYVVDKFNEFRKGEK